MHIQIERELKEPEEVAIEKVTEDALLPVITLSDGRRFYVAQDFEQASDAAVLFWKRVIQNKPDALNDLIGESVLNNWEQGKEDGPGEEKINTSLQAWIENTVAKHPDRAFGHFAGCEVPANLSPELIERLGFDLKADTPVVYPVPDGVQPGTIPPLGKRPI